MFIPNFSFIFEIFGKKVHLIFLMGNSMHKKFVYIRVENIDFVRSSCDVAYIFIFTMQ